MLTIDADAHVLETEQTWESMDGAERKYRPRIVGSNEAESKDEYWLVDGTTRRTNLSTRLCSGSTTSSPDRTRRTAVNRRKAPNSSSTHSKR